jgi:hypothetical protein
MFPSADGFSARSVKVRRGSRRRPTSRHTPVAICPIPAEFDGGHRVAPRFDRRQRAFTMRSEAVGVHRRVCPTRNVEPEIPIRAGKRRRRFRPKDNGGVFGKGRLETWRRIHNPARLAHRGGSGRDHRSPCKVIPGH